MYTITWRNAHNRCTSSEDKAKPARVKKEDAFKMHKEIFPLLLLILVHFQVSSSVPLDSKQDELTELGTSGDVTFFAGHEEISKDAGRALCQSRGLILAEVHYLEHEILLQQALAGLDEFSHYHTGGSSKVGLDALVWDPSNSPVTSLSAVDNLDLLEPLCLFFRVPDYPTLWTTRPCSDTFPPICQTPIK